jgi:5-formyltetrahydrofolate cyclo-ligase
MNMFKKSEIRELINSKQFRKQSFEKKIKQKILEMTKNKVVCTYIPFGKEPDILNYINNASTLCTTFIDNKDKIKISILEEPLVKNKFGVLQPKKLNEINEVDIFLIPGLAFDLNGTRLGRGGGVYDKLLADYSDSYFIGVSYDEYIFENLPIENHDIKMNALITPSRFIEF